MAKKRPRTTAAKEAPTPTHGAPPRANIPTAEYEAAPDPVDRNPLRVAFERRDRDLDPQLVWRGKDRRGPAELTVHAPPLFIQEKVQPKVLVDDLVRETLRRRAEAGNGEQQPELFSVFNGPPSGDARTGFYRHDAGWSNRMILGDSLQAMASLAEREGLRGRVQCIYMDPPYGIKFNSNFQWSTTGRDAKDEKAEYISREPEQVKAFRDTWRDGIHSYLTHLRDRLTVARELLTKSGSIFVQIGDENVHHVRTVMDEVFGARNFVALIPFRTKTMPFGTKFVEQMAAFVVWYANRKYDNNGRPVAKYRKLFREMNYGPDSGFKWGRGPDGSDKRVSEWLKETGGIPDGVRLFTSKSLEPSGPMQSGMFSYIHKGVEYKHPRNGYGTGRKGMDRLSAAERLVSGSGGRLRYALFADDKNFGDRTIPWDDTTGADNKVYVVQTNSEVIKRCVLMTTDPGDLVLDPTCGAGTTGYVAEQWGRRWITIDTSRVALALARARIMGARYPWYLLADSPEGQRKEGELNRIAPSEAPTRADLRLGFVYERVPHVTLGSIANNAEIDAIRERWRDTLEPLREDLNARLDQEWEEWQVPREADRNWPAAATESHRLWREARLARRQEIDASIAARADVEYLYDKPCEDPKRIRVAGPFTVEGLSPHRPPAFSGSDESIDGAAGRAPSHGAAADFAATALRHLAASGVQQARKAGRITFSSLDPWPGERICAEGRYAEGEDGAERRAAIVIGPEFGTLSRHDLARAAREAAGAGFDVLIACAFNFEAHAAEFDQPGGVRVLKARMNADLHMADDLANTGKGNLFVIFGEPNVEIRPADGEDPGTGRIQVVIRGVDVFHPSTGEVRSDGPDGIACWFIDTDYDGESFFVRQAYFLGANDPYKALKTTLKAEIDADAWESLHSGTSRPFERPESGQIAVKVINHLGDEVMRVFSPAP